MTIRARDSATYGARFSDIRRARRLRRHAGSCYGKGAPIGRGQARVPIDPPVPGNRADERGVPRLCQGPHRAALLWRPRRGFEHAMADDPGGKGEGSMGNEGLRSVSPS